MVHLLHRLYGVDAPAYLTFHKHVSAVARSCNSHAQAIRHIRHLLTTELAQTLACSLIPSRIDYCNAVLHGAPSYSIKKLQRVQNNAARIVLETPRRSHASPLLRTLHCMATQGPQHIDVVVPPSPNPGLTTQPQHAIGHYDAVLTFHNDDFCEARLPMLCSGCLKLTTENCR